MPIAIHPPVKGLVHGQVPYESNPVMGEKESTTTSDHLPSGKRTKELNNHLFSSIFLGMIPKHEMFK